MRKVLLEKDIEKKFCETAKAYGLYPVKMTDLSRKGAPDRMVLCNGGSVFFVEFKRPGLVPSVQQLRYHDHLTEMGFNVYVCDSMEEIHNILDLYVF